MINRTRKASSRGFALILALLLMLAMLVLSIAVFAYLNTDQKVTGQDKQHTEAFYSAEAGMEKLVSDVDELYSSHLAPTEADIESLGLPGGTPPAIDGTIYPEYSASAMTVNGGLPASFNSTIATGPEAGLEAQIVPIQLHVTAERLSGEQARMIRTIQVASIPVFQFALFTDRDTIIEPGGAYTVGGRVQINGNLFVAAFTDVTFQGPVRVAKEIVRDRYPNATAPVYFPTAANGCATPAQASATCRPLSLSEGSWLNGQWPYYGFDPTQQPPGAPNPSGKANPDWQMLSLHTFNDFMESFSTGAQTLTLPFVKTGVGAIELIRRPVPGEDPTSTLGISREFNKASIRILLSDDPYDLSPLGPNDPSNVRLANVANPGVDYSQGVPLLRSAGKQYFAEGVSGATLNGVETWNPPINPTTKQPYPTWSLLSSEFPVDAADPAWAGPGGWLRVEYRQKNNIAYTGITQEWLRLGFARQQESVPNSEKGIQNVVNPDAILILQETRLPSNHPGLARAGTPASRNNWYPINLYDTAEGEFTAYGAGVEWTTCALNGIMNVVELDVNNLNRWLTGALPGSGAAVDWTSQNGYLIYFSDRRGMLTYPGGRKVGEYGFEDTDNPASSGYEPNNVLDPGEDTQTPGEQGSGVLDTYGASNLGLGFGPLPAPLSFVAGANGQRAVTRVSCEATAKPNWVSGARHALRLINASLGNLPSGHRGGGFGVASENPLYLLGNFNANAAGGANFNDNGGLTHVPAAIYADKIKTLSTAWVDENSFLYPVDSVTGRAAATTYYRFAAAGGFSAPPTSDYQAVSPLTPSSLLESWQGVPINYKGSLVVMFTSRYATNIEKLSNSQYTPPIRNISFDADFNQLAAMPPGTPSIAETINTGFQQVF
jgi:hypothetical protein